MAEEIHGNGFGTGAAHCSGSAARQNPPDIVVGSADGSRVVAGGSVTDLNQVLWESLDPKTFEDMVAVLISHLNPASQRLDGSGGDGGRDIQVTTDEGLVMYQLKSFSGRMHPSRRKQVEASLKRASQHEPTEWLLVVPIDHTPAELEWFDQLAEEYGFECRWLGKTWLDGEMARRPEIARYYVHGQRYELSELFDLLRGINAEPPPVESGIVPAATERAQRMVAEVNEHDPHYMICLELPPEGNPSVTVLAKYPGAERDRSWFTARLAFSDTEEGERALQSLQDSIEFGTRCVVPSEFITEAFVDIPAGLGTRLDGYELEMASAATISELPGGGKMALVAADQHGVPVARLPLEATDLKSGTRGGIITLSDKSGAVTAEAKFDALDMVFELACIYTQPGSFSPLDLLPALKFAAALEGGALVSVDINGETLGPTDPGTFQTQSSGEVAGYARLVEHLVIAQTKTGVFFDVDSQLTVEEELDIVMAGRLLNGETVAAKWEQMELRIIPEGRQTVENALGDPSSTNNIQSIAEESIELQGIVIPLGQVARNVESARVLSWTEAEEGSPPGTTILTLVPNHSDTMTLRLVADK
ncbi:MAG: restriction endonuclease [bacterium]|nr:restriction endonuclease [bacterium]